MPAIALGLSASLCWGLADFLGGVETRRLPGLIVVLVSQACALALLLAVVVVTGGIGVGTGGLLAAAVAGVAGAIGITSFYTALSIGTMSIVAPITATGVVVPVLVGLADGDQPTTMQTVGMVVAAAGVVLSTQDRHADREARRVMNRSVLLAGLAALSIGIGLAALDRAGDEGVLAGVAWARVVSVGVLALVVLAVRPTTGPIRGRVPALAGIGLLDMGATALYTAAATKGLLSVVAVSSSLYPAVTVVLARIVLQESVSPLQAAGVTAALGGVVLIAGG